MVHVQVDVVERGRALVTGPGFSGRVWRQDRRLHVEDSDSETYVGAVTTYAEAGTRLARWHGHRHAVVVTVDRER